MASEFWEQQDLDRAKAEGWLLTTLILLKNALVQGGCKLVASEFQTDLVDKKRCYKKFVLQGADGQELGVTFSGEWLHDYKLNDAGVRPPDQESPGGGPS